MPAGYIAIHLLLTLLCVAATLRLPRKGWLRPLLGTIGLALWIGGFVVERRSDLAWSAMALGWPDLVFFTNLSLPGVAVLLTLMWQAAPGRPARVRALLLSIPALFVALFSLRWYFASVPANLEGTLNAQGFCRQTGEQSCGAAAAVTLLNQHGIHTTEAEMARLCLTREGFGTAPLGTMRGVAIRGREKGLHARLVRTRPGELDRMVTPCIVSVGLRPGAPREVSAEMEGYGWTPGLRHAIVILSVDPVKRTLRVADPSYGLETWPAKGLEWIWDGRALVLK